MKSKTRDMAKIIDLTGQRFGKIVVQNIAGKTSYGAIQWDCLCDCGKSTYVFGVSLRSGKTNSCGCLQTKHGKAKNGQRTKAYRAWLGLRERCNNPFNRKYADYGGRGIKVCVRWNNFSNFLKDMGEPDKGMSLDRIDNNGDYSPDNCRWATIQEQASNKRSNVWITHRGKTQTVTQWAREVDIKEDTLRARIRMGWTIEEALTKPVSYANHRQITTN